MNYTIVRSHRRTMAIQIKRDGRVVVHELAHIRHKNHGPDFYRLVEGTLPDYRQRIGLLKLPPSKS